jgi:hypothetical protein
LGFNVYDNKDQKNIQTFLEESIAENKRFRITKDHGREYDKVNK